MPPELRDLINDLAVALKAADARLPQARSHSRAAPRTYQPGVGPHSEDETVELIANELAFIHGPNYRDRVHRLVAYSSQDRQKCDLCIGAGRPFDWVLEVKLLRLLGDNGKPNGNMLMHVLSPYTSDRSAVTDCKKLLSAALGRRKAVVIVAYEDPERPAARAVEAFERLATMHVSLGPRIEAPFAGLAHPVHREGCIFAWEVCGPAHGPVG